MGRTLRVLIGVTLVLFLVFAVVGSTGASVEPQLVRVTLRDYQVELSQFTVAPGKLVTFLVTNEGSLPHQFVVQPYAGAVKAEGADIPTIAPGTMRTFQLTLGPGVYRVSCALWDHSEKGMLNALAVETPRLRALPVRMDVVIPLLAFVLGGAFIVGDTLGLRLTLTARR